MRELRLCRVIHDEVREKTGGTSRRVEIEIEMAALPITVWVTVSLGLARPGESWPLSLKASVKSVCFHQTELVRESTSFATQFLSSQAFGRGLRPWSPHPVAKPR